MPSGAKKRKAAKKKKEKEANINSSSDNPQGNDDLKSQDEKGSDGGEGSSPAYHDHDDHHHPFNEESEEVEEGDRSVTHPSLSDIKSIEEVPSEITNAEAVGGQEDRIVKIESDLKSEESFDRVNDSVEHVKSLKESTDRNGNYSGTLNVESLNENHESEQRAVTSEVLTYSVDSSAEVAGGHVVKIVSDLKSEKSSDRINDSVAYVNFTSELVKEREVSAVKIVSNLEDEESSDKINERVGHVESVKESHYGDGNSNGTSHVESFNENNSNDDPNNSKQMAVIPEDLAYTVNSSSTKNSLTTENVAVRETSNFVVEPDVNSVKEVASLCEVKTSDDGSALLEESTVSQSAAVDLAMKKHEDKVFPSPDQYITTLHVVESPPTEYGSKVSASASENPTVTLSTPDADPAKGSESPECSENQPQLVSAPRVVQKTAWLNCCGLFELLSGSNR